jgi:parallel beta-helix repeat protein
VYVFSKGYTEFIEIDKCINLTGEEKENTTIWGGWPPDPVITVTADWVNITGFTIRSGLEGIKLSFASHCRITGNIITKNEDGISLRWSSDNIISNNEILLNTVLGLTVDPNCFNNTIRDNYVAHNDDAGIYVDDSVNNSIINNMISYNGASGLTLHDSLQNRIIGNQISENDNSGIYSDSSSSNISGNNISLNSDGIHFYYSDNNTVTYNNIYSNKHYAIYAGFSSNCTYHHNNIILNDYQINIGACPNTTWDDGQGEGNYWSDYCGLDDGSGGRIMGDGVGDTEIPHPEIDQGLGYYQLDNYPLIDPVGNCIFLYKGWNLISIPFIQSDMNIGTVLSSIAGSYDSVWWYNVSDTSHTWGLNNTSKPPYMNDLDSIDHTIGFWIHITQPGGRLFKYPGVQPTQNQTITFYPGWNMVGYPSLSNRNRTAALNNITFGSEVDSIWTYNAATQRWDEISPSDYFEVGRGYWIHSKVTKVWDVPL